MVVKKQQSANYCASEHNAYWGSEITRQNFLQSKCHILHSMKDFQSVKQIVKVPVIDLCVVEYVSAWLEMWSQSQLLSKHCIKFIVSCWYHFKCFCTMFINICWIKLHSWRRIWMIREIPGFFKQCLSITGMELIIEIYIQVFKGNCCNLSKERFWIQLLFSGRFSWVRFWLIFHFSNKKITTCFGLSIVRLSYYEGVRTPILLSLRCLWDSKQDQCIEPHWILALYHVLSIYKLINNNNNKPSMCKIV